MTRGIHSPPVVKICSCGREFSVAQWRKDTARYCSTRCVGIYTSHPQRGGSTKTCPCGKEFYVPKHRSETARFCSLFCQNHGQYTTLEKTCESCGKKFAVSSSRFRKRFCSQDCRYLHKKTLKERRQQANAYNHLHRGRNASRNLKTLLRRLGRALRCVECGYDEYAFCLDVDHIDGNCENNVPENLQFLCAICHRIKHWAEKK